MYLFHFVNDRFYCLQLSIVCALWIYWICVRINFVSKQHNSNAHEWYAFLRYSLWRYGSVCCLFSLLFDRNSFVCWNLSVDSIQFDSAKRDRERIIDSVNAKTINWHFASIRIYIIVYSVNLKAPNWKGTDVFLVMLCVGSLSSPLSSLCLCRRQPNPQICTRQWNNWVCQHTEMIWLLFGPAFGWFRNSCAYFCDDWIEKILEDWTTENNFWCFHSFVWKRNRPNSHESP